MKDMKIKHRLIISFTLVSIAMMILSTIGSITLAVLGHTINLYSNKVQGSVSLMSEIRTNFERAQKEMFRGLGSESASTMRMQPSLLRRRRKKCAMLCRN